MTSALESGAERYGVRLDASQRSQFERYITLIAEWSARVNLVGDADRDVLLHRHVLESIALGAALREREVLRPRSRVLDLGAGAGFPGIPIKLVWAQCDVVLIEATAKKTAFLEAAVRELGLDGASVRTGRAEDLAHEDGLRESFDLVLARAVAPLRVLVELGLPFAKTGGRLVTPKGSRAEAEVSDAADALRVLAGRAFVVPFNVPGPKQWIVAVQKLGPTPAEYPRRPGMPAKSPL